MEVSLTKDKILRAAMTLFADRGYDNVSMREIAAEVGIKAASIYNHFQSKRDILKSIYKFYANERLLTALSLENLLRMAETEDPRAILTELTYRYPTETREMMAQALAISSKGINGYADGASERFIREYLFDASMEIVVPLLNRMIELGKIEPLDVEAFAYLLTYYSFSAAVLNPTDMKISPEKWNSGMTLLFSLIKPVEQGV